MRPRLPLSGRTSGRTSGWTSGWSFRRQIVVLTAVTTGVGMLLVTLVLQLVLAAITSNDVDRVLRQRADATVDAIQATSSGGKVSVPDAALDPGVAVFDGSGELIAGDTPRSLREYYEELSETGSPVVREVRGPSKLRAQPFRVGDTPAVVIVTERLRPYEEAESLALLVSLVTGVLATAAASGLAGWAVRRALVPVTEMASTASDWSEHDLGRRFALGPPTNEISVLAETLDTLLDKVSAAIRSEQRLTAELAHELRTPLTSIQGTADLMLMREGAQLGGSARADLAEISASSRRMAATITTLLDLARSETTAAGSAAGARIDEVVAEAVAVLDPGRVAVEVHVDPLRVALPHALAVRAVSPVLDNALRFATHRVRLTASVVERRVELAVADDGPGVDDAAAAEIFEPGRTSGGSDGAGLGLAIARRIARAAGGDVRVDTAASGPSTGARFVVDLPLA